jgi:hypothetical protein
MSATSTPLQHVDGLGHAEKSGPIASAPANRQVSLYAGRLRVGRSARSLTNRGPGVVVFEHLGHDRVIGLHLAIHRNWGRAAWINPTAF